MNRNPLILIIGFLIGIIVILLLFTFQVRKSEVAVVTTFGKPTRPITEPGLKFKGPWPIQRVYKFDQRVQNFEDKQTEGLTRDGFNLITSVYVGWKITEVTNFFPTFAGYTEPIQEAERNLERLLSHAKSSVFGKHPLSDIVSASDNGTNFVAIENEILAAVQTDLRAQHYGIDIDFLGIKRLQIPESVTQNVFERMTSERKVLADRSQYEGESQAAIIKSEAERKAGEMLARAESEATRIRGEGEAKAAESLKVFNQNPDLAILIFQLNALESSLKEHSILVFDPNTPPFNLFRGVTPNLLNPK
jgi:membrane protease subunit HflC